MAQLNSFVTPVGEAVFPWLYEPDTRYVPEGVYQTLLSVPFEEAQTFIAELERIRDDYMDTLDPAKRPLYNATPVYTEEYTRPEFPEGATDEEKAAIKAAHKPEPTGNVLFKLKMKAKVQPRDENKEAFTQSPVIVSAETGEKIEDPVYMGSIIRVKGQVCPYSNAMSKQVGVSLRMKAVQVVELVTGGNGGGSEWTDFDKADVA
jgi:hypothetical protein